MTKAIVEAVIADEELHLREVCEVPDGMQAVVLLIDGNMEPARLLKDVEVHTGEGRMVVLSVYDGGDNLLIDVMEDDDDEEG